MKPEFLRSCKICGSSNFEKPLRAYSDGSVWIYLCHDCEAKVLAKTGGEIPLESLNKLGGVLLEEWEWEEREERTECCGMLAQEQFDLCRGISLLSQL